MITMKSCLSVAAYCFLCLISSTTLSVHAQIGFQPLSTEVPQDVNGVQLGIHCDGLQNGRFHTGIVTVEAAPVGSTNIQVLSYPPDLVTVVVEDTEEEQFSWFRYLRLEYNPAVAGALGAGPVGVKILFPSDQLEGLSMCCHSQGQLLGNFPNLRNVEVTGSSELFAAMTGEVSDDLLVTAQGMGTNVYLSNEGGTIPKLKAQNFAYTEVTTFKVLEVDIGNSATASLNVLVPPGGTVESSGDSSTASLHISSEGGCKRIIATNAAKCTDGVVMDLKDVTAIVADVSNWVVEGETQICSKDLPEVSGNNDFVDQGSEEGDKNGANGTVIGITIVAVVVGVSLLAILALVAWRMYNKTGKGKPTTTAQALKVRQGDQKHDIEAPAPDHRRMIKTKSEKQQSKTKKKNRYEHQDLTMTDTTLREDEHVVIPATPPNKRKSIPNKKIHFSKKEPQKNVIPSNERSIRKKKSKKKPQQPKNLKTKTRQYT